MGLDASSLEATRTELLGEVVENLDVVNDVRGLVLRTNDDVSKGLALNHSLGVGVGQLGRRSIPIESACFPWSDPEPYALDDSSTEPLLDNLRVLRHREDNGKGETLLTGQQTADLLAKRRRQHWDSTLHEVHACRALPGVTVEGSVGFDEVGDVGNVHADIVCTVVISLDGKRIVKILSVNWIDGKDTLATKVFADIKFSLGDTRK